MSSTIGTKTPYRSGSTLVTSSPYIYLRTPALLELYVGRAATRATEDLNFER